MDATPSDEWLNRIGRQVRSIRISRGLTQAELATLSSLSTPTINKLEAGRGGRIETLISVLRVLGRSDWFDTLDPGYDQPSPLAMLELQRRQRPPRQRVTKKG